jgi:hypothetical protein
LLLFYGLLLFFTVVGEESAEFAGFLGLSLLSFLQ